MLKAPTHWVRTVLTIRVLQNCAWHPAPKHIEAVILLIPRPAAQRETCRRSAAPKCFSHGQRSTFLKRCPTRTRLGASEGSHPRGMPGKVFSRSPGRAGLGFPRVPHPARRAHSPGAAQSSGSRRKRRRREAPGRAPRGHGGGMAAGPARRGEESHLCGRRRRGWRGRAGRGAERSGGKGPSAGRGGAGREAAGPGTPHPALPAGQLLTPTHCSATSQKQFCVGVTPNGSGETGKDLSAVCAGFSDRRVKKKKLNGCSVSFHIAPDINLVCQILVTVRGNGEIVLRERLNRINQR